MAEPRTDKAIEFLQWVYPEGPWALTSIAVDKKGIDTRTFYPPQLVELQAWLDAVNGKRNVYWHVNPVLRSVNKKAEREDIKEVCYLHVDIDPRAGEDPVEEMERAIKLLLQPKKVEVPPPTFILSSGGGVQAFWKLEEPIPINGEIGRAEDAKRYNIQLELLFGGDNCHNIDRLMRLPGTINIPDAKKKKKGRKPKLAEVLEYDGDKIYPISAFHAAQTVQGGDAGFSSAKDTVKISGNVKRIESVEDLAEWNVPDRVKVIIVQGTHPDEVKQPDNSRSAWLFDCICNLVRAEVPDDLIFSIVTDPDLGIAESVLDKGRNATKYALRQIERGKEEAVDPWLRKMNEKHAVIGNYGGKCRIVEDVMDPVLKRSRLTTQSFDDIRNRYMHIQVQVAQKDDGTPIFKALGKWWLEHPKRRQFESIVFAPGQEIMGAYNLWKGFACEAKPGNCDLFLKHILDNICCGDKDHYHYLVRWMARGVQYPDRPGQTAVVMRGKQGTGKSFFAKTYGSLFGRHFMQVSNSKHLVGQFNAHLRDCVVLFGDEAFYAGDKQHESVLKTLITEETLQVEAKGIDIETANNCTHVLMASNSHWVIPAGANERRFFVLDVGDEQEQKSAYFKKIVVELDSGGREALLHYLSSLDLSEFEVRNVPKTTALHEQRILSMSPEEEWWYKKLVAGQLLERHSKWEREIPKPELMRDYTVYMQQLATYGRRANDTTLGKFLFRVVPKLHSKQKLAHYTEPDEETGVRQAKRRVYVYQIQILSACRKHWETIYGKEVWPSTEVFDELPIHAPEPEDDNVPF